MANKQIKEKENKYGKSLYKAEIVKIPRSSKGLRLSAQISWIPLLKCKIDDVVWKKNYYIIA